MVRKFILIFAIFVGSMFAQNQVGISSWNDVGVAPFENDWVSRGATAFTGHTGHNWFDVQLGERYTFGQDGTKPYERQIGVFGNLALRKAFKYGLVRGGGEVVETFRTDGHQFSVRPFAEAWFGGWSQRFPASTWATFTREQFKEGYVARGNFNQGWKFYTLPMKLDLVLNGGPGFAYGAQSANPWNRQATLAGGLRIQRKLTSNGVVGVGGSYTEAWRPNGLRDRVIGVNVFWWFGKTITL